MANPAYRAAWLAYTTPQAHRVLPMVVADRLIRTRAQRQVAASAGDRARLHMEYLLGRSSRAVESGALAEEHLFQTHRRAELRWRPWLTDRFAVEGLDRPDIHRWEGHGVLTSFMHHAQAEGVLRSFSRLGYHMHVPVLASLLEPTAARPFQQQIKLVRKSGNVPFAAGGSYEHMLQLLKDGQILSIAADLPGTTPVTFLGRQILVASGTARLALETGAPILPITSLKHGRFQRVRMETPLLPTDFTSVAELTQALFDAHAPAILAWPEAVELPLARSYAADPAERAYFDERHADLFPYRSGA